MISNINRLYKAGKNNNLVRINILKGLLSDTKEKLKSEFAKSISNYWENKVKNIAHGDSKMMFPQINAIFRRKGRSEIPTIIIPKSKITLVEDADIPSDSLLKDNDNNFVIANPQHKLNVIGAHFAAANNQNNNLGKHRFSERVMCTYHKLETDIAAENESQISVSNFSNRNPAFAPSVDNVKNYFISMGDLTKIFRNLNNKRSSSFDGIPNIILKNLPSKIIFLYAIIFNNALNNKYFPDKWKIAKVIALKKDKDGADPSSY